MHVQVRQPVILPASYPPRPHLDSPSFRNLQYTNGFQDALPSPHYHPSAHTHLYFPPPLSAAITGSSISTPVLEHPANPQAPYGQHHGFDAQPARVPYAHQATTSSSTGSAYSRYDREAERENTLAHTRSRGEDYRPAEYGAEPAAANYHVVRPYADQYDLAPPTPTLHSYPSPSHRLLPQIQTNLSAQGPPSASVPHTSRASLQNLLNPSPIDPTPTRQYFQYAPPPPFPPVSTPYDTQSTQSDELSPPMAGKTNGVDHKGKRKRTRTLNLVPPTWTMMEEIDPDGKRREIIVLDDTPPPPPSVDDRLPESSSSYGTLDGPHRANGVYTNGNGNGIASGSTKRYHDSSMEDREIKPAPRRTRANVLKQQAAATATVKRQPDPEVEEIAPPPTKRRKNQAGEAVAAKKAKNDDDPWKERRDPAVPPTYDDKEGHYVIIPGDIIGTGDRRYKIHRLLGQGTFGKVVECTDLGKSPSPRHEKRVAVKIIRAIQKYRDASKIECRVLERLKQADPNNMHQCIHAEEVFDFRNHICIVSELLGMCVYDFLKENDFQPFPRDHIWDFARQLLDSVAFLHSQGLVHTDLKPENILLVNHEARTICTAQGTRRAPAQFRKILLNTQIRLIDFGSATFETEYHSSVVSTRHYRAPEIILGMGWSFPCDAYSIGCILVEFYTGTALFQTHDNVEHLAMMEIVMGAMPTSFKAMGRRNKPEFFKSSGALDWPKTRASKQSKKDISKMKPLDTIIPPKDDLNTRFLQLVRDLLAFDPKSRIKVHDALRSGYIRTQVPPESVRYLDRWRGDP